MKKLFYAMLQALEGGEDFVLCSIIASSGSTPRGKGAKMAVFSNGSTLGTIGGGAVEYESIRLAMKALNEKTAFTKGFNLAPNQTADIGMICGGQVTVYFQYFSGESPDALETFKYIVTLFDRDVNTWLITDIKEGGVKQMGIYEEGKGLVFAADINEGEIKPLLKSSGILRSGEPAYYVEPLTQAGMVYVFGGGHVSQELVPVITHIGFQTVVFDERDAFANPKLFPQAFKTVVGSFKDISKHIKLTKNDYVVIMTRGHQSDYEILEQALRTEACYIGVIGSRHKIAITRKRLLEAGFSEEEFKRVHTPIGLPIKGETPAEIAISIAGELILHRAEMKEATI